MQAADQQQALAFQPRRVEPFDMHQAIVAQLALERAIQARPPLLLHLALQGLLDLQLGAWPQPFGRQFGRAMAEAVRDVVAREDEVRSEESRGGKEWVSTCRFWWARST